jgi:predicted RecA/RadA family phage recombinase
VKKLTYVGPHDAVEIEVAPRKWVEVKHGAVVDVGDQLAVGLLDQPDNWKPAKTTKSQQED